MGQSITVESRQLDSFCVFSTDRSMSGQEGSAFDSAAATQNDNTFPAVLAQRLFAADDGIDHVYVASNDVVVRRSQGWDEHQIAATSRVIEDLFRYYSG